MESRQRKKTWGRKLLLVLVVVAVVITLALQGSKEVKADPVVDVTGLEAGGVKSHDCDDYAVTKSNATKHWYVCAVCGNEINSKNILPQNTRWGRKHGQTEKNPAINPIPIRRPVRCVVIRKRGINRASGMERGLIRVECIRI